MSRPKLDPDSATVTRRFRVPAQLILDFADHCVALGYTTSERLRQLMERDLRALAGIRRLKKKGSK